MYLVLATHNTGHGLCTEPVILTPSFKQAVDVSNEARTGLGFEYYEHDCDICVIEVNPLHVYRKGALGGECFNSGYRLIRRPVFTSHTSRILAGWQEQWIEPRFRLQYEDECRSTRPAT